MVITGIQRLTLLDFPGNTACTIFTAGCNFRCHFCHNPEFVLPEKLEELQKADAYIPEQAIFNFLEQRKGLLDGVCVTGGEPTIQPTLKSFIQKIKDMGFKVKLDTNGTNPHVVKDLVKDGLLDYIAMDIKSSPFKYGDVTNVDMETPAISSAPSTSAPSTSAQGMKKSMIDRVQESKEFIMTCGLPYEFRSTILPYLHPQEEFEALLDSLQAPDGTKANNFFIQNFRAEGSCINPEYEKKIGFTPKELEYYQSIAESKGIPCDIRS